MHKGNSAPFQHSLFPELPADQFLGTVSNQSGHHVRDDHYVVVEDFDDEALPSAEGHLL